MLNVFLTVDTEVWPLTPEWRETRLAREMEHYIYGVARDGRYGLPFQMDVLDRHGLKAVFFVEALFASAVGLGPLREIVGMIRARGHDVQLHLHTEWLSHMSDPLLGDKIGQHLKDFSEDEQALLIARGLENLRACGVERVCAFRAGNYGANFATLRALARHCLPYDTSYNACYLDSACDLRTPALLLQPVWLHGVHEFPISFFRDRPRHYRHAQLCACSSRELEHALTGAWERGWYAFVLVTHSGELLKRRLHPEELARVDGIVVRRFERLCRFLASHRDRFRTAVFSDLAPETIPPLAPSRPLSSGIHRTAWRLIEQAAQRLA
jgi:hypothetical protein